MYAGIISKLNNVRPHMNANNLNLATVCGYTVIISKDYEEGVLGCFFPSDGQLSPPMCFNNNLYRHRELNINPEKGGFFEDNRRVKAIKIRGVISEGFWVPVESLKWAGDISFKEGYQVTEIGGNPICNKYVTPETHNSINRPKQKSERKIKLSEMFADFKTHWDVGQVRYMVNMIPKGALLYISEKCHGCVDKDTLIDTKERGKVRIQEIVDNKEKFHVKTLNTKTNKIEYEEIGDWYFYANDDDWYEIELEDGRKLEITGNNPVWLPEEGKYVRVDELTGKETLLVD